MVEPSPAERWRAFYDSWAIRILCYPWGEKIGEFAARGLTGKSPRWHRWLRVVIVAVAAALFVGAAAVGERLLVHYATAGWR